MHSCSPAKASRGGLLTPLESQIPGLGQGPAGRCIPHPGAHHREEVRPGGWGAVSLLEVFSVQ